MSRHLEFVRGFIAVNLGQVLVVQTVPAEEWDPTADVLHAPFGYLPPRDESGTLLLAICPELIAAQLEHLDDDEAQSYLLGMELHIDLHIVHWHSLPDEELEVFITRLVRDTAPTEFAAAEAVQLRALGMSDA